MHQRLGNAGLLVIDTFKEELSSHGFTINEKRQTCRKASQRALLVVDGYDQQHRLKWSVVVLLGRCKNLQHIQSNIFCMFDQYQINHFFPLNNSIGQVVNKCLLHISRVSDLSKAALTSSSNFASTIRWENILDLT